MKPALGILLSIVTLDAIGIGIVFPVLPGLLRELSGTGQIAVDYGVLLTLYALAQFLCSPVLGGLSDRFGRRPVLLLSLAGAAIDYGVMACAPTLWLLFVGRLLAGVTGANMVVATATIADLSSNAQRARHYGYLHACIGLGLVVGPALGGLLGQVSLRYPFMLAALLNLLVLAFAWRVLPESNHQRSRQTLAWRDIHPFDMLRGEPRRLVPGPVLAVIGLIALAGVIPHSLWAIYGESRFDWDPRTLGLSLALLGLLHALVQSLALGRVVAWLGERRAAMAGLCIEMLGYVAMALVTRGWMVFAVIPLLVAGGIAMPTLQALLSRRVPQYRQGQLQGLVISIETGAGAIGPIVASTLYALSYASWTGWVWLLGALLSFVSMMALSISLRTHAIQENVATDRPIRQES